MKTLIVEDDVVSRILLQELLQSHGPAHVAVNGREAVAAVAAALQCGEPYDLICLDIMMPEMDGQQALREIRALEAQQSASGKAGAKILMTTARYETENVMGAFREQCDGYLVKPVDEAKLCKYLRWFGLAGPKTSAG
jgi:two-component system chemotaxis response regulator CheY